MREAEKQALEREIEKLKMDLNDYMRVYPYLDVKEKEMNRVINQYLDDILNRQERLKNE
jgi:hypothetical protein